jgi:beta-phosphoglucomutase
MNRKKSFEGCIFDLDGVIVDTAKFHYLAWKSLANSLNIDFNEHDNEALKGVSRKESLNHILQMGGLEMADDVKLQLAESKNKIYIDLISNLDQSALLPGVTKLLGELQKAGIKISLGSASKNAIPVLESTGIMKFFDFIADGNSTEKSKPDPEVFFIAAKGLNLHPEECIVFEDSVKGLEAAEKGGFKKVGIGDPAMLSTADFVIPDLAHTNIDSLDNFYQNQSQTRN